MGTRTLRLLKWFFVVLASIALGYLAGLRQSQQQIIIRLQVEAAANLTQRLETLSSLRLGDVSKALTNLEQEADQLTLGIAGNQGADRRVLLSAKAYRSVVPPPASRAKELAAVFDTLPEPRPSDCGNALQLLLKTGGTSIQNK
jgi:hypothetical protein